MNEGDLKENCDFQSITTRAPRSVEEFTENGNDTTSLYFLYALYYYNKM